MSRARLSVNPIAYWLKGGQVDRSTANLGLAMEELSSIGFRYVKADVPSDMEAAQYLTWLEGYGMKPALTLFSESFKDPARHHEVAEKARAFARVQASLGLHYTMLSTMDGMDAPRMAHPAIGFEHDDAVFAHVIDGMRLAAQAMQVEGVTAALHPHIGGAVETEAEIREVLDSIDADLLKFAPDTGHMAWGGSDVAAVIRDYADRVVAVHLKDIYLEKAIAAKAADASYFSLNARGALWAEPGTGSLDFTSILDAFPPDFAGDFMIEVDVPSTETNLESHRISYAWAVENLPV